MIQTYFDQIKSLVDRYAAASFVLDVALNFEMRPGNQGYLTGEFLFIDGSRLHFREYLDSVEQAVEKLTYTYHYQEQNASLIFRYDNALHRPLLPYREHKHSPDGVRHHPAPALEEVLTEVIEYQEWR